MLEEGEGIMVSINPPAWQWEANRQNEEAKAEDAQMEREKWKSTAAILQHISVPLTTTKCFSSLGYSLWLVTDTSPHLQMLTLTSSSTPHRAWAELGSDAVVGCKALWDICDIGLHQLTWLDVNNLVKEIWLTHFCARDLYSTLGHFELRRQLNECNVLRLLPFIYLSLHFYI